MIGKIILYLRNRFDKNYWRMTEVFVYLHNGKDYCNEYSNCKHCDFIERTFT